MLQKNGYRIKVLNTINFTKSCHYNPFAYIRSEKDILKLVNTIIVNTKGEGAQATEDFWVKEDQVVDEVVDVGTIAWTVIRSTITCRQ